MAQTKTKIVVTLTFDPTLKMQVAARVGAFLADLALNGGIEGVMLTPSKVGLVYQTPAKPKANPNKAQVSSWTPQRLAKFRRTMAAKRKLAKTEG